LAQVVAAHLNSRFQVTIVSYLDDWLIFGRNLPADNTVHETTSLGLTINTTKSILQPTTILTYLGLNINVPNATITPTYQCLRHMDDLVNITTTASKQDLRRIAGYVLWLCWAMNWPTFLATHLLRNTYWYRWFRTNTIFNQPRKMAQPLQSIQLCMYVTSSSIGIYICTTPPRRIHQPFTDQRPIAYAEMTAAIAGLNYVTQQFHQTTRFTLFTDSLIMYYTFTRGKGITRRQNQSLQWLYCKWIKITIN
jgi:hypothetical protein